MSKELPEAGDRITVYGRISKIMIIVSKLGKKIQVEVTGEIESTDIKAVVIISDIDLKERMRMRRDKVEGILVAVEGTIQFCSREVSSRSHRQCDKIEGKLVKWVLIAEDKGGFPDGLGAKS